MFHIKDHYGLGRFFISLTPPVISSAELSAQMYQY